MDGSFKINLSENHLKSADRFTTGEFTYQALESPKRKWYKVLFQWLTLGFVKAPYEYQIKLVEFGGIHIINSELKSCVNTNLYCCGIDEYDKDSEGTSKGV